MDSPDQLALMMHYSRWANARLFSALQALPPLALQSRLLGPLAHAHRVDMIWQAHLTGRPHGFTSRAPETLPPLDELSQAQSESDTWYCEYAAGLSKLTSSPKELVRFELIGGNQGAMTRAEILLHVANHKTYHRGYVAQVLVELGSQPPIMDLPVFLREQRAAP